MIYLIALIVIALALAFYFIRLFMHGRRLRREREEGIRRSVEQRNRLMDKMTPDDEAGKPFVIDKKPFKLWKAGAYTFGEAVNETRRRAGYPPLEWKHGEDRAFYPNMRMESPDDDTKTWPGPEQPA